MEIMDYEEIELIKQGENSTVQLIREKSGGCFFIRKVIKGRHFVYFALKGCSHPCLPRMYDVSMDDDATMIIEEYIEGQALGSVKLSGKQFLGVVRDLCSVLEMLHGMGIIHRDIKPSNIVYREDGHICLVDFDTARVQREEREQDTRLLGTRGYAPPEQYGFSQTDVRTDIYSLGVTLEQIVQNKFQKLRYRRIIRKCKALDPDKRYQSIQQVRRAFFHTKRSFLCCAAAIALGLLSYGYIRESRIVEPGSTAAERYPNQIVWRDVPVRDYLGRYMDDVMDEIEEPYDEYIDEGEKKRCAYRKIGIIFYFDERRRICRIALDPELCTFNGETLNVNKEKILDFFGNPAYAGWTDYQSEEVEDSYWVDYYDTDTKEGMTIYMWSPEEEAYVIYID